MSTSAERMARKRASDRDRGIVQINVRVPADKADELKRLAAVLRGEKEPQS